MSGERRRRREIRSEEIEADGRRRWSQERARAELDRRVREEQDPDDVAVPDGPDEHRAPGPSTLGRALDDVVRRRGWAERLQGAGLEERWAEVVGDQLAARSRPGRLAGGRLVVIVDSPRWATQLQYLTDQIQGRVAAVTGTTVREVRIVVGGPGEHGPGGPGDAGRRG